MSRCDEFIARLEDRRLQEGGPWPQDLLIHASSCPRCAEILAIFQSIPREVSSLPRGLRLPTDAPTTVVISLHEGIPVTTHPVHRLWLALSGVAAVAALALALALPSPLGREAGPLAQVAAALPVEAGSPWRPLPEVQRTTGPMDAAMAMTAVTPVATPPARVTALPALSAAPLTAATPPAPLAPAVVPAVVTPADGLAEAAALVADAPAPARRVTRGAPPGPELPRVRVGQGLVFLSDEWGDGAAYGGEIGLQSRIWFDRHLGLTLDGGVRYGVAPGFDPLPDSRDRSSTAGSVAGAGSVMLSLRARPATLGMGVGVSAGEWDPGPGACDGLSRDVPERSVACEDWGYVSPDLVASVEFDVSDAVSLGVRWTGHEQALELGRGGEVDAGGAWVNRVTLDATFRPGVSGGLAIAAAEQGADEAGSAFGRGIVSP